MALAHQLVEQDHVLLTVGIWGTPANLAIRPYLNDQKVPQLFVAATESAFDDPAHFPWTMGFQASKRIEGLVYARYILHNKPGAKIGHPLCARSGRPGVAARYPRRSGDKGGGHDREGGFFRLFRPASVDAQIVALKNPAPMFS